MGWGRGRGVKLLWVVAYCGGRVALERQRKEIGGNAKDRTRGQLMRSLAFRVGWGLGGVGQRKELGGNVNNHMRGLLMHSLAFRVGWGDAKCNALDFPWKEHGLEKGPVRRCSDASRMQSVAKANGFSQS